MEYPLELALKRRVTTATGSLGIPDSRGPCQGLTCQEGTDVSNPGLVRGEAEGLQLECKGTLSQKSLTCFRISREPLRRG